MRTGCAPVARVMLALLGLAGVAGVSRADTLTFDALMDNTIYAESGTAANGGGEFIFVGRNSAGSVRRGLVRFDVASIPTGSTITGATLTLHASRTQVGPQLVSVHRLLQAWGEGTSDGGGSESAGAAATADDATWTYRLYNTQPWTTPGGTVMSQASDSILVDAADTGYSWSAPGVTADVTAWVNNPSQNFGWEIIGPENVRSSKRFNSRTHPKAETRPKLTVTFTPSTPIGGCCLPSGACAVHTRVDCEALSGTYRGDSVYCEERACEGSTAASGSGELEAEPDVGGAAPVVDRDKAPPEDARPGVSDSAGGVLTAPLEPSNSGATK